VFLRRFDVLPAQERISGGGGHTCDRPQLSICPQESEAIIRLLDVPVSGNLIPSAQYLPCVVFLQFVQLKRCLQRLVRDY